MRINEDQVLCPKCFTFNSDDSDSCHKCGAILEEQQGTLTSPSFNAQIVDEGILFSPGSQFGKRYRIIEEIGRGGMGRVYKAEDLELNITVALKLIRSKFSRNRRFVDKFKKEILSARSISHENVIRIYDLGKEKDIKYFSMEYIKGQNLKEFIRSSSPLAVRRSIEIIIKVSAALRAAHKHGIIHRDLSPSNIMIDNNGQVYVMDFGLAQSLSGLESKKPNVIEGTPRYMSPEQIRGEKLGHTSDIYSLGLIFYELLTGQPAFDADSRRGYFEKHLEELPSLPSQLNPDVPPDLNKIITKCLEKSKEDRFQSVDEFIKELTVVEDAASVAVQPKKKKESRHLRYFTATVAAVLIVFFVWYLTQKSDNNYPHQDNRISVSVVNFENLSGDSGLDHLSRTFSVLITQDLLQSTLIRPMSPSRLYEIHQELKLEGQSHYTTEDLKKFAELGDVDNILWGSFSKETNIIHVDIFLYDSPSMEIVGSDNAEGMLPSTIVDILTPKIKSMCKLPNTAIAQDIDLRIADITTDSPLALANYLEGARLYDERKFKESNSYYIKAIDLDPSFAMAYRKIAINFNYLRDIQSEKAYLEKAWAHIDNVSQREKYLIKGYYAQTFSRSAEDAIKQYQELLELYPDDILGNIQLGAVYRNMEEWDKARIRFQKVLEVDKNNMLAHHNLVGIHKARGNYQLAINLLQKNKHVFPPNIYHRDLSRLYFCNVETELALEEIEKYHTSSPGSSDYFYLKGMIYQARGEFSQAEKLYKRLQQLEDTEERLTAQLWLARLFLTQGRMENAKNEIALGLLLVQEKNLPSYAEELFLMSSYLNYRTGEIEVALEAAVNAHTAAMEISFSENERLAILLKGFCFLKMGDIQRAELAAAELKNIIVESACSKFMRLYHLLQGTIAYTKKDYSQSVDYLEMAASALPYQRSSINNHILYYDALAKTEEAQGNTEKAQSWYERITALTSGRMSWGDLYARSYARLGKIYQAKGMKIEAINHFEKYLDLWERADHNVIELAEVQTQLEYLKNQQ